MSGNMFLRENTVDNDVKEKKGTKAEQNAEIDCKIQGAAEKRVANRINGGLK